MNRSKGYMNTREDKYLKNEEVTLSRTKKNQALYEEMSEEELDGFSVDSNTTILDNNRSTIDVEKLKSMLDKKYRDPEKKVRLTRDDDEEVKYGVNLDETREYDINEILSKAKDSNDTDYEVERLKKIRNTNLDILNGLSLADKMDDDDEDKEEKDESKKLRELIDTINMKESLSDGADPLDILSDLKGDDDETKVLGAKDDFMKETTKEAPVIRGLDKLNLNEEKDLANEIKKTKEEKKDIDIDLDKTNENTFLTTTNLFTESDFDDFNDLKEEVAGTKIVIKILIVIVILAFIVGLVFVLNKFLNLGWF